MSKDYKVCYRLKKKHRDTARPESIMVQESPNLFTEERAEYLAKVGDKHFTRADHWVERRR